MSPLEAFHPTIGRWFERQFGEPTPAQRRGWPTIRSGAHTLIAAPTGSGKTLAAFLSAIDQLLACGTALPDQTRVLYVSPLKALGNDIRKNLDGPLRELRELDPDLPEIRVQVRSGDTPARERAAMRRRPPHILVTTPESLFILLTSDGGREQLKNVRTVIVDEIHAVLGDKRGAHLALSLERLEALTGELQRIGLSATQKPLADVGQFLVGTGRECTLVDEGHVRELDVAVEIPESPLAAVCSHETWAEMYERMAALIREHRTTLVFVGTRKLSERVGAQLSRLLGDDAVACHHSSLSKERRLDAEERLKAGELRALVATASLELGIDIGDVDLVIQVGSTRSIATFLQRVGRAGHGVGRVPVGRLFPLTQDELVESAAILRCVARGELDRTPQPCAPLDILAQQIVAACVSETWSREALFGRLRRAWPYRGLDLDGFDSAVSLHTQGRLSLLHRDEVHGTLRGTRRARLAAITAGGAIPDTAQYQVRLEPEGTVIGSVDEDFAVESSAGDVFQLGNTSWRVLRITGGVVFVVDTGGAPPSLPFWFGEAPARTRELSAEIGVVRERGTEAEWLARETLLGEAAREQLATYLAAGKAALGVVPTQSCVVLERFFDESGGMQLVLHAPFGRRINRAFGLALRKRFCRHFGFELQAAANEEAVVLSLGPMHSFPLEEVFDYLQPETARELLIQAVLPTPLFTTRWRHNVTRALVVERTRGGKRVPAPLLRMRADDALAAAFPDAVACGENLPAGDLTVPMDHPLVAQTIDDCLHEAMDVDGFVRLLEAMRAGSVRKVAIDTPEPSPFARSILSAAPYAFLDDAPLEERRTQAVHSRRNLDPESADTVGALDPEAIARVRTEAWPDPRDAEEVHEALLWMGFVTDEEAPSWSGWLKALHDQGRIVHEDGRWFALEATRDPQGVLRGRMEALGPVFSDDPLMQALEGTGAVLRVRIDGRQAWCDRRLLARIQRYTLESLRRQIQPVSAADLLRFLAAWQHADPEYRLEGPAGVSEVARQLAGFQVPVAAWEKKLLAGRVRGYRPEWLDQLTLSGELAWGRLFGGGRVAPRSTPVSLFPREELDAWLGLADPVDGELSWPARALEEALAQGGAQFQSDLAKRTGLLPSDLDRGLAELVAAGLASCDSFAALRALLRPTRKRTRTVVVPGRWSLFRGRDEAQKDPEFVARVLLRRYGVVFRALLERERQPVPWRDLVREYRGLELRGDVRGGRFVARFSGEQFALPQAIPLLRKIRNREEPSVLSIAPADPLNLHGILIPDERVAANATGEISLV